MAKLTKRAIDALATPDVAVEDDESEYGFEPDDDTDGLQDEGPQDPDAARDPGTGWLAPAVLGYAATTAYARRVGVRADFLHAFAEPLVGLVQFVSVRQWRSRRQGVPWWRHGWIADDVFVVSQNPDFLHSAQQKGQPA